MKLFLALAFVAVAAAVPEPIRLPEPVKPQVAELNAEVDAVRFVDAPLPEAAPLAEAPQPEEVQVDVVKFVDAPLPEVAPLVEDVVPQAEEVHVDAVKFVDAPLPEVAPLDEAPQAEEIQVDAVKFVDAPLPEDAAETDAIKNVHVPLEAEVVIQPEALEDIPAPVAEEIQVDPVRFVDAPLEEVAPQAEEVDAVRFVDAPVQEDVKVAREPEFVVHAPVELLSAAMPVVQEEIQYGLRFVDVPQDVPIVAPVFLAPINPFIDASHMIVPQQIMDLIMAEQAQFDASGQEQPRPVVFVDPMLR